jgi:hypothetical protein
VVEVTFHCPGSMLGFSDATETAGAASRQSNIIPGLFIRLSSV